MGSPLFRTQLLRYLPKPKASFENEKLNSPTSRDSPPPSKKKKCRIHVYKTDTEGDSY